MLVPLGAWLPDRPPIREAHLRDAQGAIPAAEGYEPLKALVEQSAALASRCRGAVAGRDLDGTVHIYAGTGAKLQELSTSATWTDRTRSVGGDYSATETTKWRFASFKDRMIAANASDTLQYIDMSTGAAAFANLPNAPIAAHVASFGEFLFCGNTGASAIELKWSAISDSEGWTPGTNQSDEIEFPDGGVINGLAVTDVLYVFQESAIRRVNYVGPPTVMNIDRLEGGRGCIEPGSLAQLGRVFFYLSEDGFYMFNGEASQPIGAEQVDEWFKGDLNRAYLYRMTSAVDPIHKVVVWSYVGNSSPSGQPDTLLMYNWVADRWSYARVTCEVLLASLTLGYTLEGLDAAYPNLDAMPISLDDPLLTGGALRFAAFSAAHKLSWFAGTPIAAEFQTGDFQLSQSGRSLAQAVYPLCDAAGCTVAISAREAPSDAVTFGSASSKQASGRAPVRGAGRWFRAKVAIPAGQSWSYCNGLEWQAVPAGRR
jgi:hypothetical protein